MRRVFLIAAVILAVLALWLLARRPDQDNPAATHAAETAPPDPQAIASAAQNSSGATRASAPALAEEFPLAAKLNAPHSTIARDLEALAEILDAWRTNFPREGNPVGENADITAALTGKNSLQLALIPKNHRAINADGELCDRWGTPVRFHQLSGQRMELKSAGPDRKFGTGDDAVWSPVDRAHR